MTWLIILLSVLTMLILLLALLLAFGHVSIRISCRDCVKVVARVLGIPFTLFSDKPKKQKKKKDLSRCHNPNAVLRRELRRQRRAAKKAYRKQLKAEKKARRNAVKKAEGKLATPNLLDKIKMITALVKQIYLETRGRLSIKVYRMHVTVGTDDAAKTALLYAAVLQSTAYLCQLIESCYQHVERDEGAMTVTPDYTGGKCSAEVDLRIRVSLWSGIGIALRLLSAYRKQKALAAKRARDRMNAKRAA